MAAESVKGKAKHLNLTDEQKGQLREREATEQAAAESALLKLYTEVWLPRPRQAALAWRRSPQVAGRSRPRLTRRSKR